MSRLKDKKKNMQQKTRRPYQKPLLHAYGTMKDLTATGSGTAGENAQGDPNRGKP